MFKPGIFGVELCNWSVCVKVFVQITFMFKPEIFGVKFCNWSVCVQVFVQITFIFKPGIFGAEFCNWSVFVQGSGSSRKGEITSMPQHGIIRSDCPGSDNHIPPENLKGVRVHKHQIFRE